MYLFNIYRSRLKLFSFEIIYYRHPTVQMQTISSLPTIFLDIIIVFIFILICIFIFIFIFIFSCIFVFLVLFLHLALITSLIEYHLKNSQSLMGIGKIKNLQVVEKYWIKCAYKHVKTKYTPMFLRLTGFAVIAK